MEQNRFLLANIKYEGESKMHQSLNVILTAFIVFLQAGTAFAQSSDLKKDQISACMAATKQSNIYAVDIPAANNSIFNRFIMALEDIGDSPSTKTLVDLLSKPLNRPVVVIGEDEVVTAATLEAALKKVGFIDQRFPNTVCFVGGEKYSESLKIAAQKAGLTLLLP